MAINRLDVLRIDTKIADHQSPLGLCQPEHEPTTTSLLANTVSCFALKLAHNHKVMPRLEYIIYSHLKVKYLSGDCAFKEQQKMFNFWLITSNGWYTT